MTRDPPDADAFSVSMAERQGIAPRADALRDTLGHPVMTLRNVAGDPEVRFLAPTSGDDLTATRLGASGAASVAPSDARVFVVDGGTAGLAPGLAGLAAVPIELDPAGGPVDRAGIPLVMADAPDGTDSTATVRARRAGAQPSPLALGVSAAPAYTVGETTVVPLATAGLVAVHVHAGDHGIPLGAPLQLANKSDLAVVAPGTAAVIVARAAQRSDQHGGTVTILAWICPAHLVAASPS